MHYIDKSFPKVINAKEEHYQTMRYILKKKLLGKAFHEHSPIPKMNRINQVTGIKSSIVKFFTNEENMRKVLVGSPEELNEIKAKFSTGKLKKSIKKLINYDSWIITEMDATYRFYNAYHLAEKLNIPTCVYCNRNYTKTVIDIKNNKITRPTFDHWFPKGTYPLLALSFFNLIPSCSVCNSGVKGSAPFDLSTHFHPYHKEPEAPLKYTFSYDYKDYNKFSFKIIPENDFTKTSVKAFELEEIYKAHEDEIEDLRRIKDSYTEEYIEILEKQVLSGINLDRQEVYRLAFGVHYEEAKFDQRPLSKMKKDLLIELGIIK